MRPSNIILHKNLQFLKRNMISYLLKSLLPLLSIIVYYFIINFNNYNKVVPVPETNYLSRSYKIKYSLNISENEIFEQFAFILVGDDYHNNKIEKRISEIGKCN